MVATHPLVICFLCCFNNLLRLWQKREEEEEFIQGRELTSSVLPT